MRLRSLDPQEWDAFVENQERNHILQLSAFGDLKAQFGWTVLRLGLEAPGGEIVIGAQVLQQPLKSGKGSMAYLPMGPVAASYEHWEGFLREIEQACSQTCSFLKWEPGIFLKGPVPDPAAWGYRSSPHTIQPPNTILVCLSDPEEEILARMNQGTRRKIRICDKNQVEIYSGEEDGLAAFCDLMDITASRKEFHGRDHEYYRLAYRLFRKRNHVDLLLAKHENDVLAGIMLFSLGKTAYYLYGASGNLKRNLMAPYGLHWEAIRRAKQQGCEFYDLWGIPDQPVEVLEEKFQSRNDGLWGVYGFKRGFGGQVSRSLGAWDKDLADNRTE